MKHFLGMKFFLSLQETSQKDADADVQVLENEYDEFVLFIFHENAVAPDKAAYHNTLVYTRAEKESHQTC
jgi:hypothetical protein